MNLSVLLTVAKVAIPMLLIYFCILYFILKLDIFKNSNTYILVAIFNSVFFITVFMVATVSFVDNLCTT